MSDKTKYRPIMVVGTGSHVGKSVMVMGLCRSFKRRGIDVAPFKAQNMALNSGITLQGGEIGRAQISQAEAAGLEPQVDMNPILLKPTSDLGSQVILLGKVFGNYQGVDYYRLKPKLTRPVMAAFRRLAAAHELVVMEGAGSCAEMNLKKHDLVNMSMAKRADAATLLVADIDAGGVFAQVVGSLALLPPSERKLVRGVAVNKFRGDPALFQSGIDYLEKKTGKPVLGLVPMFNHIELPQEDGVSLERGPAGRGSGAVRIGVVRIARISNFTDADALAAQPGVELNWITKPEQLAGLDLVILPGTKNTLAALSDLKDSGLFEALKAFHRLGGHLLGLCGGYQILGRIVADPLGVEGPPSKQEGLGLLDLETVMAGEKTTTRVQGLCLADLPFKVEGPISGYEIHMGQTNFPSRHRPALRLTERLGQAIDILDGQVSDDGRVVGTYLHGLLDNDNLRAAVLDWARCGEAAAARLDYAAFKDSQYDRLADHLEAHLDLDPLLEKL